MTWLTLAVPAATGSWTLTQAAQKFLEDSRTTREGRRRARYEEAERLKLELREVQPVFSEIIDYASELDLHLRVVALGEVRVEEVATRNKVDRALDHLRRVRDAVRLGLIEQDDLGPWVYWIRRVTTGRPPVRDSAKSCGYGAFLDDLTSWTAGSRELAEIRKHCRWMKTEAKNFDEQRGGSDCS